MPKNLGIRTEPGDVIVPARGRINCPPAFADVGAAPLPTHTPDGHRIIYAMPGMIINGRIVSFVDPLSGTVVYQP